MNFLLHRHLAATELSSRAAGVGAMLPDLWRMVDRRVRASDEESPTDEVAGGPRGVVGELAQGVRHHLAADAWFHGAPVFVDGERATIEALRVAEVPRSGLFAHVTWELCLDGALVRSVGAEALQWELRRALGECDGTTLDVLADRHHFARVERAPVERARFQARMRGLIERLAVGPAHEWIAHYATARGVSAMVSRIRERVGLASLTDEEAGRMSAALEPLLPYADRALHDALGYRQRA